MKKIITLIVVMLLSSQAFGFRCGTQLVEIDDLKIQVKDKCGEPVDKEVVGYTIKKRKFLNAIKEREFVIEHWVYKASRQSYRLLTFEGGRLKAIEKVDR